MKMVFTDEQYASLPKPDLFFREKFHLGYIPRTVMPGSEWMLTETGKMMADTGWKLCKELFNQELYYTQAIFFFTTIDPRYRRIVFIAPSRYGKSATTGMTSVYLSSIKGLKVRIGSQDKDTAQIVSEKIIEFLPGSSEAIKSQFDAAGLDKIEKLTSKVSQDGFSSKSGGYIKFFSYGEKIKNTMTRGQGAIGRGGDVLIDEELLLVSKENHDMGSRMLTESENSKHIAISNPHKKSWAYHDVFNNPNYLKIHIDWRTAVEEGRVSYETILEQKVNMSPRNFRIMYECLFPSDDELGRLFQKEPILLKDYSKAPPIKDDVAYAGLDTAWRGEDKIKLCIGTQRDLNTLTNDYNFYIEAIADFTPDDWSDERHKEVAANIVEYCTRHKVVAMAIDIGGSSGPLLYEAIKALNPLFEIYDTAFNGQVTEKRVPKEKPEDHDPVVKNAFNKRAEMYLDIAHLSDNGALFMLRNLWKADQNKMLKDQWNTVPWKIKGGKTLIAPKDDIKDILGYSPDELDSLVLCGHAKVLYNLGSDIYYGIIYN